MRPCRNVWRHSERCFSFLSASSCECVCLCVCLEATQQRWECVKWCEWGRGADETARFSSDRKDHALGIKTSNQDVECGPLGEWHHFLFLWRLIWKAEEEILVVGWMFPVTNLNQAVTPNNNLYPERYKHQITAVEHSAAGWGRRSERPLSNAWSVAALPVSSLSSRPHKDLPVKSGPLTPSFSLLLPLGCVFLCVYVCGFFGVWVCECVWGLGVGEFLLTMCTQFLLSHSERLSCWSEKLLALSSVYVCYQDLSILILPLWMSEVNQDRRLTSLGKTPGKNHSIMSGHWYHIGLPPEWLDSLSRHVCCWPYILLGFWWWTKPSKEQISHLKNVYFLHF